MATLPGTPDLVRSAADQLAARADGLRSCGSLLAGAAQDVGAGWGGPAALAAMHRHLVEYLTHRAGARTVHSIEGTIDATYAALERVLTSPA